MSMEIEENKGRKAKNRGLCRDRGRGVNKKQKKEKNVRKKVVFFKGIW